MRRTLLLLALLAPAAALGQTAGGIVTVPATDATLNIAECESATGTVRLRWTVQVETGSFSTGGVYRVLAAKDAPPASGARYCVAAAAEVGAEFAATSATQEEDRVTGQFAPAAGLSCSATTSAQTVHVCVHWFASGTDATPSAWAVGTLTLDTRRPPAPTGLASAPGDGALRVSWAAPTGGNVAAAGYRVELSASDGSGTTREVTATATSVRVDGLVNGTQYDIRVFSVSAAGNDSATSAGLAGTTPDDSRTPQPVDSFWDMYDGVEQGGCAAGAAGPFALLGLAGLLAVLRRRK